VIDLHCHLLPGIDDGPRCVDESLALARAIVSNGITHAIATPHIYPGKFDNDLESIRSAYESFLPYLQKNDIPLELDWAAEIRLTSETMAKLEHDELPFLGQLGQERTLLIELPDGYIPSGTEKIIAALTANRYRAVIAHPERNKAIMAQFDRLKPLVDAGAYLQITAASVIGEFGLKAQIAAFAAIESGWVAAIASDAHNLKGRAPKMSEARQFIAQRYGQDAAEHLFWRGPAMLCAKVQTCTLIPKKLEMNINSTAVL
jgi:protein-tyrosine phosphatase